MGGSSTEVILPNDGEVKPSAGAGVGRKSRHPQDDTEAEDEETSPPPSERNPILGELPPRGDVPSRRAPARRRTVDVPAAVTSATGSPAAEAATSPASTAAVSAASGSATASSPTSVASAGLGGTFPALPASPAAGSGAAAPTPSSRPASKPVSPPQNKTSEPVVADAKKISGSEQFTAPAGTAETAIKPIIAAPPTGSEKVLSAPETQAAEAAAEKTWLESMKIPAGTAGLFLSPNVLPLSPNAPATLETSSVLMGATWKSGFDGDDKPTLQILKECEALTNDCQPHALPAGGPAIVDYLYKNAPHSEDLIPDSKESLEIGTVSLGAQSEAAFHIQAGSVPGKYVVQLFTKDKKLSASFEVADPAQMQASTQPATMPTTQPSIENYMFKAASPSDSSSKQVPR